jgi:tRNA dimethylallyltransferase
MVEMGLIEEVKRLIPQGLLENRSASQAIGYRHVLDLLNSAQTEEDFHHFLELFKQDSRHYAKRQLTWFRKQRAFRWLDLDLHDPEVVRDIIKQDYELAL